TPVHGCRGQRADPEAQPAHAAGHGPPQASERAPGGAQRGARPYPGLGRRDGRPARLEGQGRAARRLCHRRQPGAEGGSGAGRGHEGYRNGPRGLPRAGRAGGAEAREPLLATRRGRRALLARIRRRVCPEEAPAVTTSAVIFDLFDTLVLLDRERLPEVIINGKTRRTTAGHLHQAFQPFAPGLTLESFVDALFWSWQEAGRLRGESDREGTAPERFGMMFGRLGLGGRRVPPEALPMLLGAHLPEPSQAL